LNLYFSSIVRMNETSNQNFYKHRAHSLTDNSLLLQLFEFSLLKRSKKCVLHLRAILNQYNNLWKELLIALRSQSLTMSLQLEE
jgi:hypothetical protein